MSENDIKTYAWSRRGVRHGVTRRGNNGGWAKCGAGLRDMFIGPKPDVEYRDCKKCFGGAR